MHAMNYNAAFKKKETLLHAKTRIDLEEIMLSEISR